MTTCTTLVEPFLENWKTLTLVTYAEVKRILFSGKRAVGVQYERHRLKFRVTARKVILSAGVYGSPLLFKSEIGPKKMLRKAKVNKIKLK